MKQSIRPFGCVLVLLAMMTFVDAGVFKWIQIGAFQDMIQDACNAAQPERSGYRRYYTDTNFGTQNVNNSGAVHYGAVNWTDPVTLTEYPYWFAGSGHVGPNEIDNIMPVETADGYTIKRYWRYEPPTVSVDGLVLTSDFPLPGDELDPDRILGNADIMVESTVNTMMGITVHQRVLAWSQQNHDDYHIYDFVLTNTGTLDGGKSSTQDLEGFIMSLETHGGNTWRSVDWWESAYGSRIDEDPDSLRMVYYYPAQRKGLAYDNMGQIQPVWSGGWGGGGPYPGYAVASGDAYLFVSESSANYAVDNKGQPSMTDVHDQDLTWDKPDARDLTAADRQQLYTALTESFLGIASAGGGSGGPLIPQGELNDESKGGYHGVRTDERDGIIPGTVNLIYSEDISWHTARHVIFSVVGPFDIPHGDSIRVVIARGMGGISPEKAYEVGKAWADGTAATTWSGPYKLPPRTVANPTVLAVTDNDKAKDSWVYSSVDSLFQNMYNAQWNFNNNYTVPTAPRAPSISVLSRGDEIQVSWGDESELDSDFAGYRVYRAQGNYGPTRPNINEQTQYGSWEMVYEVTGDAVHTYHDSTAIRGQPYFYAVTAFDDGVANNDVTDLAGNPIYAANQVLESSIYLNRTTVSASLLKPPGDSFDDIRVVPNPYSISAIDRQFLGEPRKLLMLNLPGKCTIRIFTESGDLVTTIEHDPLVVETDLGTEEILFGDETWGGSITDRHMASDTGQIVVSGVYIAYIETEDESGFVKFAIVR